MKNRLIVYVVLMVVAVSTIITTVSPSLSAKTSSEMTPTEQMKSWIYYNSLSYCIKNKTLSSGALAGNRIKEEDAQKAIWFAGSPSSHNSSNTSTPSVAYFLKGAGVNLTKAASPEDEGIVCDDPSWIVDAASLWGYANPVDLLCDTGALRTIDGADCRDGQGDFSGAPQGGLTAANKLNLNTFQLSLSLKVYGGNDPAAPYSSAAAYTLARNAFYVGCLNETQPTAYLGSATGRFLFENVADVAEDGLIPNGGVKYLSQHKAKDDSVRYSIDAELSSISNTCQGLVQDMQTHSVAYKLWAEANPDTSDTPDLVAEASSCIVEGLGWIICPVINVMAGFADSAYGFLADNFLSTPDTLFDREGDGKALYDAWSMFLSIANIIFVIGFLVIIFSQLTGVGVSNYGVKKMLPRLIIGAVLINLSFYICAIAIDLSNILGYGLKTALSDLAVNAGVDASKLTSTSTGEGLGMQSLAITILAGGGLAAGAVASAGGVSLALVALIPIVVSVVIAIFTIFIILVIRQVLIVLLIALSPVAFAAYLLPNTNSLFTKWRKMFTGLLLLFPVIGLVYGAAALASSIITSFYTGTDEQMGQVVGAGILVLPLLVVPVLLKKSLNNIEGIGGKIAAIGSKAQGGAKSKTSGVLNNSRGVKHLQGVSARRRTKIQAGTYTGKGGGWNPNNWKSKSYKKFNEAKLSGEFGDRAASAGAKLEEKEHAEAIEAASSRLDAITTVDAGTGKLRGLSQKEMIDIATGRATVMDGDGKAIKVDTATKHSAMQKSAKIATATELAELIDSSVGMGVADRNMMSSSVASAGALASAPWLGARTLGEIQSGTASSRESARRFILDGNATAGFISSTKPDALKHLVDSTREVIDPNDPTVILSPVDAGSQAMLKSAHLELMTSPDPAMVDRRQNIAAGGKLDAELSQIPIL